MSEQNRMEDTAWLSESLSAVLDADPPTVTDRACQAAQRDYSWAGLMGPAGMSFTPPDLRVDDMSALILRLFDVAIDEWFELSDEPDEPREGAECAGDDSDAEEGNEDVEEGPLDSPAALVALSDDCCLVDDRTTDEVLWSLLVDSWWRAAPPFVTTNH